MEEILSLYKEHLTGKEFIYNSTYGGKTFGIIESVGSAHSVMSDKYNLIDNKFKSKKLPDKIKVPRGSIYSKFNIYIISDNGISYDLNEIHIKDL